MSEERKPRVRPWQAAGRRCKRCKSDVTLGFDCYQCPKCGVLQAGLFDPDPTEPKR